MFAEFNRKATAGDGTMVAAQGEIMPAKAYLVFTKESWGCLGGQEIVADVTEDLNASGEKPVLVTEVKNPEDVDNRMELYLYYPAREISGLAGYYVLRLGVQGSEAQLPETLWLAKAALVHEGQDLSFRLKAKTTGQLQSDLLYAGDTRLVSGFFTCAAAGLFEANSMKFLQSYPVHTQIAFTVMKIDSKWDKVTIPLEDFQLKEAEAIATCYGLLNGMEKEFSVSKEHLFLWDQSKLTPDGLGGIASSLEKGQKYGFNVNIELEGPLGTREIQRDPTPFIPQLRQMIAARNARGKITGGSVMIAVEKSSPE